MPFGFSELNRRPCKYKKLADQARARQEKADRDEEERYATQRTTDLNNAVSVGKSIASGRLSKKVAIDESSIDPRGLTLLAALGDTDADLRTMPAAVPPPIVWKAVTPPEGAFTFMLPSPFDVDGKLYFAKGEGMSFLMTYIDLPAYHPPATVDEIIGSTASAVADSVCAFSLMAKASCEVRFAKRPRSRRARATNTPSPRTTASRCFRGCSESMPYRSAFTQLPSSAPTKPTRAWQNISIHFP